jgi:hypothetical protein
MPLAETRGPRAAYVQETGQRKRSLETPDRAQKIVRVQQR